LGWQARQDGRCRTGCPHPFILSCLRSLFQN